MSNNIRFELKRMADSRLFWLAILLSCSFSGANILQNLYYTLHDINNISVFEKWIGYWNETYGAFAFYWFFPILAAMPYAWTLCDEIHGGYAIQILTRSSKTDYFTGKMVSSFISGGMSIAAPLVMDILLLTMIDVTFYPQPNDLTCNTWAGSFGSLLFYKQPALFVLLWTSVSFLWGGAIALLCCAMGLYIKKKYVLIPSMLLIFLCEAVLSGFFRIKRRGYFVETSWLAITHAGMQNTISERVIFGSIFLIMGTGILLMAIKGMKRYESL